MDCPGTDKLIVAAGDNQGDLGLWDVDNHDIGNKGVFKYHPHIEPITKLHCWESDASKLYSASYDGKPQKVTSNTCSPSLAYHLKHCCITH